MHSHNSSNRKLFSDIMERLSFNENVPNSAASEDLSFEQFLSQMKLTEMTYDQINQHDPYRLVLVNMYDTQ